MTAVRFFGRCVFMVGLTAAAIHVTLLAAIGWMGHTIDKGSS